MVRGQVSAISYFSSNFFFSRLQLPCRTSTFRTTSILLHNVNSFPQLQLFFTTFPRIRLSCTTSTYFTTFSFFTTVTFFYDCNTSTFQQDLNIAMSKWIWTPPPLRCQCIRTEECHLCCDRKEHRHHPKPPNR